MVEKRRALIRPPLLLVLATLLILTGAVVVAVMGPSVKAHFVGDPVGHELKLKLRGTEGFVRLVERPSGELVYEARLSDGTVATLTPDEFAARLYEERTSRAWWLRLLNVSSAFGLAWVALGLLGQVLFAGRMIVQWLVSERSKRSIVPVAFWWMSLIGASMLLTYFLWRKDVVGVLGQGTGWMIYTRNLVLIYKRAPEARAVPAAEPIPAAADPGPEPALVADVSSHYDANHP